MNTASTISENRTSTYTVWHGWWIFGGYKTHYNHHTVSVPNPAKQQAQAREEAAKRIASEMNSQVSNLQSQKGSWSDSLSKSKGDLEAINKQLTQETDKYQKLRDVVLQKVNDAKKSLDTARKTIQDTLIRLDIQEGNVKEFLKASASLPDLLLEQATESIMLKSNVECFSGMLYQHFKGAEEDTSDAGSVAQVLEVPKYSLLKKHNSAIETAIGDLNMPIADVRTLLAEGGGRDELIDQVHQIEKLTIMQRTALKGLLSVRTISPQDEAIQREEISKRIGHFSQITCILVPALVTGMKKELENCTKYKQINN